MNNGSLCLINYEWSESFLIKPSVKRVEISFSCHCLLAYLRQSKDFDRLQTWLGLEDVALDLRLIVIDTSYNGGKLFSCLIDVGTIC